MAPGPSIQRACPGKSGRLNTQAQASVGFGDEPELEAPALLLPDTGSGISCVRRLPTAVCAAAWQQAQAGAIGACGQEAQQALPERVEACSG